MHYTSNMICVSYSGLRRSCANMQNKFLLFRQPQRNNQIQVFHFFVVLALSYCPDVFCFVIYRAMPLLLYFFFLWAYISLHSVE